MKLTKEQIEKFVGLLKIEANSWDKHAKPEEVTDHDIRVALHDILIRMRCF